MIEKVEWGLAIRLDVASAGPTLLQWQNTRQGLIDDAEKMLPPGTRYVLKQERSVSLGRLVGFTWGMCWYRHVKMDDVEPWPNCPAAEWQHESNHLVEQRVTP